MKNLTEVEKKQTAAAKEYRAAIKAVDRRQASPAEKGMRASGELETRLERYYIARTAWAKSIGLDWYGEGFGKASIAAERFENQVRNGCKGNPRAIAKGGQNKPAPVIAHCTSCMAEIPPFETSCPECANTTAKPAPVNPGPAQIAGDKSLPEACRGCLASNRRPYSAACSVYGACGCGQYLIDHPETKFPGTSAAILIPFTAKDGRAGTITAIEREGKGRGPIVSYEEASRLIREYGESLPFDVMAANYGDDNDGDFIGVNSGDIAEEGEDAPGMLRGEDWGPFEIWGVVVPGCSDADEAAAKGIDAIADATHAGTAGGFKEAGTWRAAKNAADSQGLVISEKTGANIAVTYDSKDALICAAAPDLLAALERYVDNYSRFESPERLKAKPGYVIYLQARAAIAKAKGE